MRARRIAPFAVVASLSFVLVACDEGGGDVTFLNPLATPVDDWPAAGNPNGGCAIPAAAGPEDVSNPRTVVGDGTPASCTSEAVVAAVTAGGVIVFDCGPDPVTITMNETARVRNDVPGGEVVIDGGGLVTLSGDGRRRILYQNACDASLVHTTSHCNDQDHPRLTIQNITFVDGYHDGSSIRDDSGGAVYVLGGRFKVVNTRFFNNACAVDADEVGGGAIRAFQIFGDEPIYVVNSTFGGGDGYGNACSSGGALSSIMESWTVLNSVFTHNRATGSHGNGGAIYNDGATMTLATCGTIFADNTAVEFGGAIFFVSNSHTGTLEILDSTFTNNVDNRVWNLRLGISGHDDTTQIYSGTTFE